MRGKLISFCRADLCVCPDKLMNEQYQKTGQPHRVAILGDIMDGDNPATPVKNDLKDMI